MEAVIDLELFAGGGTPPTGSDAGLDEKLQSLYEHLRSERMVETETALLALIATYPNSQYLAGMLPNLMAVTIPKILGTGSHFFGHADGKPLRFGGRYSPPEYTMVYLELLMNENWSGEGVLSPKTVLHQTITVMWSLLLELMPPQAQSAAQYRMDAYKPLPDNVIRFRPSTKTS